MIETPVAPRRYFRRIALLLMWCILFCIAVVGLVFGWGLWTATRAPRLVQVELPLARLPEGESLKVVILSDIHAGRPDMSVSRVNSIVDQTNALQPDLVLLAGDYHGGKLLDLPSMSIEAAIEPLSRLRARYGVYAVQGNHDPAKWTPWAFARNPTPRLLLNSHVDAGPVVIIGFQSIQHGSKPRSAVEGVDWRKPVILLMHEPEQVNFVDKALPVQAIAGHTHGGQVWLPLIGYPYDRKSGTPVCRRGLCEVNGIPLYVTSGIGTSWLPIRIGVPPEIVEITFYSGRKSGTER